MQFKYLLHHAASLTDAVIINSKFSMIWQMQLLSNVIVPTIFIPSLIGMLHLEVGPLSSPSIWAFSKFSICAAYAFIRFFEL